MLEMKDLKELVKIVSNADPKKCYSYNDKNLTYADLNSTLRAQFNELAGDYNLYRENKNKLFALIETAIDEILPHKVLEAYGQFAEVKTFNQGDKPVFVQKITEASRRRAKQFITRVGLAGVYEVFKLDGKSFEVPTAAFGGAAQIGFEEFLDGRADWNELTNIVMEGINDDIYIEIRKALEAVTAMLPGYQKATVAGTDVKAAVDKVLAFMDSIAPSTIYCTLPFAAKLVPENGWVNQAMMAERWEKGYLGTYNGHNVVVLPQSYDVKADGTLDRNFSNATAYIIAGNGKPVKIAFEGETHVREAENADWSREIQVYRKVGVGVISTDTIGTVTYAALDDLPY